MKKILVVPDIHGTHFWEKAAKRINEIDLVVMLGDYVDNWENDWPDQGNNLENIISFKKENPNKVVLLFGNHDLQYVHGWKCSGFQATHAFDLNEIFIKNKDLFNIVHIEKNYIFSHAGVSAEWMNHYDIATPQDINKAFHEISTAFKWQGPDVYGNSINESPMWIRPDALIHSAVKSFHQIVGHTEIEKVPLVLKTVPNGDEIILTDSYNHEYIHEIEI
jgi:predicted phosphodiesterase